MHCAGAALGTAAPAPGRGGAAGGEGRAARAAVRRCCARAARRRAAPAPRRPAAWRGAGGALLPLPPSPLPLQWRARGAAAAAAAAAAGDDAPAAADALLQRLSEQAAGADPSAADGGWDNADPDAARRAGGAGASTSGRSGGGGADRQRFLRLAQLAERELQGFDIRTDVPRAPNAAARWRLELLRPPTARDRTGMRGPGLSLAAMAAAAERAGRRPRQEVRAKGRDGRGVGEVPAAGGRLGEVCPPLDPAPPPPATAPPPPPLAPAPAPGAPRAPGRADRGPRPPRRRPAARAAAARRPRA
jgi:hypothetical protein